MLTSDGRTASLLRHARRRGGLTQSMLAARSGVAQSLIARYETGRVQPSLPQLERLVAACGLTVEIRLAATDPSMRAQVDEFRKLSVEDRIRSAVNLAGWRAAIRTAPEAPSA